jgi:hypothetical protein
LTRGGQREGGGWITVGPSERPESAPGLPQLGGVLASQNPSKSEGGTHWGEELPGGGSSSPILTPPLHFLSPVKGSFQRQAPPEEAAVSGAKGKAKKGPVKGRKSKGAGSQQAPLPETRPSRPLGRASYSEMMSGGQGYTLTGVDPQSGTPSYPQNRGNQLSDRGYQNPQSYQNLSDVHGFLNAFPNDQSLQNSSNFLRNPSFPNPQNPLGINSLRNQQASPPSNQHPLNLRTPSHFAQLPTSYPGVTDNRSQFNPQSQVSAQSQSNTSLSGNQLGFRSLAPAPTSSAGPVSGAEWPFSAGTLQQLMPGQGLSESCKQGNPQQGLRGGLLQLSEISQEQGGPVNSVPVNPLRPQMGNLADDVSNFLLRNVLNHGGYSGGLNQGGYPGSPQTEQFFPASSAAREIPFSIGLPASVGGGELAPSLMTSATTGLTLSLNQEPAMPDWGRIGLRGFESSGVVQGKALRGDQAHW